MIITMLGSFLSAPANVVRILHPTIKNKEWRKRMDLMASSFIQQIQ